MTAFVTLLEKIVMLIAYLEINHEKLNLCGFHLQKREIALNLCKFILLHRDRDAR